MEHSMEHSMVHSMDDSMEPSMEHSMKHLTFLLYTYDAADYTLPLDVSGLCSNLNELR